MFNVFSKCQYDRRFWKSIAFHSQNNSPGAAIPPDLLANLEQATLTTDMTRITQLVQDLRRYDRPLAEQLRRCADEFDYTKILKYLQQIGS